MLRDQFLLDEGYAFIEMPKNISLESYQDLADRIEIFMRGIKRRAEADELKAQRAREQALK